MRNPVLATGVSTLAVALYMFAGLPRPAIAQTPARTKALTDTASSPHARLRPVNLADVTWTEGFWADRYALSSDTTLNHLYALAADPNYGHALANMQIAAGLEEGAFVGTHWQDAWVYKWIEAAAAVFARSGNPHLDQRMDQVVETIAQAQQPDGYLASQITARRWKRFQDPHHHELYTMGHLLTAACIHHRATGKTSLLNVARRTADFLCKQFAGKNPAMAHFPRNPSVIMGAVELYRTTGNKRYLDLANTVIDMRGAFRGGSDLNQDRLPLRNEHEVVGHAVFYTYLYAGAADAYMETGDQSLLRALHRLREDLVTKKMYITGGCCALHRGFSIRDGKVWNAHDVHEAVGPPYYLPNATAYNETCSQVGNFMWHWRMLLIEPDARYADTMEREMFNGFLSGISLDGKQFFYSNPLRWYGAEHELLNNDSLRRHEIGKTNRICCPTNVLRTLVELSNYVYSTDESGLWVHHYGSSVLDNGRFKIRQETNYPWEGTVTVTVEKTPPNQALHLRIPAWARSAKVQVNGRPASINVRPATYTTVTRALKPGDEIVLELPLDVRMMIAHPKVEAARNHVAIMRGPILYCLESTDLPDEVKLAEIAIPTDIALTPRFDKTLLGGVTTLEGQAALFRQGPWSGTLYQEMSPQEPEGIDIRLIPYYAWANRGISEMSVWLPLR